MHKTERNLQNSVTEEQYVFIKEDEKLHLHPWIIEDGIQSHKLFLKAIKYPQKKNTCPIN